MTDEAVGGELVPEPRRIGDLKAIPEQVKPECRELARSLRELFGALGVSLRVFAVRVHYDAGTVSRYLNGTVVPPAEFVDQLLTHAAKATGRASSVEVMAHVHALQRRALQVTNKVGWELQRLRDQLADADRQRQQAEVRAEALSEALLVRQQRIAEMEVDQRQAALSASLERDEREAEVDRLRGEHEGLRTERDRLREEVARLRAELAQARRQALEAERRCEALEHQLQTEEEAAAEQAGEPAELRLAYDWARQLERELARLRAREKSAAADVADDSPPAAPRSFAVVHADEDRLWADWIAHVLRSNGQRVAASLWGPAFLGALEQRSADEVTHILLFSEHFFAAGARSGSGWEKTVAALLRAVPLPMAVVTGDCALSSGVDQIATLDLRRLGADAAERALLRWLAVVPLPAGPGAAAYSPRFPGSAPAVWDGVPRRNPRFTGRDALLVAVHDRLQAAPADTAVVALVGLPGIGKTQLAAEYAHRYAGRYDVVWWASGEDRPTLEGRLARFAPVLVGADGARGGDPVRAALDALRRGVPYERWLLVLDGAEDPEAIAGLLPAGRGHVLITSRNRAWADHYAELLDVPPLSREESVAFVRRRAPRIGAEDADRLAAAVEDLPLPLDQTAGWLDGSTTPVAEYVRMVSDGEPSPGRPAADYPMPYHAAFKALITQLRETTKAAAELLSLCALFDPGPVPLTLLRAVPADQLSPAVAALLDNPSQLDLAMGKLVQRSAVRVADDAVWMSRFVRDAVRRRAPQERQAKQARLVRTALALADPGRPEDPATWPRYAELLPHLESSGALESSDATSRRLVLGFLRYLTLSGDYARGMRVAERAAGDDHDLTARRATLSRVTGDFARAEALDRSVLVDLVESDAPGVLVAMARLADDLRGLARYDDAYQLDCQQRDLCAVRFPDKGPETRNAQRSLSHSLRMLGRYAEAAEMSGRTLASAREALGPLALSTLSSETDYAYDLRLSGRYEDALSLQAASAERHREVLGDDHPWTLVAAYHHGLCACWSGDPATGLGMIYDVCQGVERVIGADTPPSLMIASGGLARALRSDIPDQAVEISERLVARYEAWLGDRHPYTIGARANHALVLVGADERARELEKALTDMTAALGPRHPWTLGIALNATAVQDRRDACALSRETAHRAARVLGARHPLTLLAQVALAADLRAIRGGRDEADVIEEVALRALDTVLGPEHPETVAARDRIRPVWDFEPLPI
ncbi:FxSxx-COOH system tetratricopeptide repeat protein [Streptomyces sp. NPDC007983]|uniref:FxSxx-COOH system tetratricopeptide repeat protein n=1 Tax=Streptomyces sp. NPDC007983 TaxID=3364800 RepID=UPI0036E763D4